MAIKRVSLSGVQANGTVLAPASGKKLRISRISVSHEDAAGDLILSEGDAADTTVIIHEAKTQSVSRSYGDPANPRGTGLVFAADAILKFTGGVAAQSTHFVVEYIEQD
jgi:hypothetical protein